MAVEDLIRLFSSPAASRGGPAPRGRRAAPAVPDTAARARLVQLSWVEQEPPPPEYPSVVQFNPGGTNGYPQLASGQILVRSTSDGSLQAPSSFGFTASTIPPSVPPIVVTFASTETTDGTAVDPDTGGVQQIRALFTRARK